MFEKRITIGSREIILRFAQPPCVESGGRLLFGGPVGRRLIRSTLNGIENALNATGGYYFFVSITPDRLTLATDITGGFRVYHSRINGVEYYTDDYRYLCKVLGRDGTAELDTRELAYWRKHRYTTGAGTFVAGINKLEPATIREVDISGTKTRHYFRDITNKPNRRKHTAAAYVALTQNIAALQSNAEPVVLLFSGGVDSTLLALLLKEIGIEFTPVFFRSVPLYGENARDYCRAQAVAKTLRLPLTVLDADINTGLDRRTFLEPMLFDRHLSVVHFEGMRRIAEIFGTEVSIVAGQGADIVLSGGPTQRTRGDLAARILLNTQSGLMRKLAGVAVRRVYGEQFRLPKSSTERDQCIYDSFRYYPMIDSAQDQALTEYVSRIVTKTMPTLRSSSARQLYLKIHSFLQGADNQVIIQAARAAGIRTVSLPYCSPQFIYATVAFRDHRVDTIKPKYPVHDLLEEFGFRLPKVDDEGNGSGDTVELAQLQSSVDALFHEALSDLTGVEKKKAETVV